MWRIVSARLVVFVGTTCIKIVAHVKDLCPPFTKDGLVPVACIQTDNELT